MKIFEDPTIEIEEFRIADILTASSGVVIEDLEDDLRTVPSTDAKIRSERIEAPRAVLRPGFSYIAGAANNRRLSV